MGAISAIRTRSGLDSTRLIVKMVESQKHRGRDAFGVATSKESIFTSRLSDLGEMQSTNSAVAYNLMRLEPNDPPQPGEAGGYHVIVESDYSGFTGSHNELLDLLASETPERSLTKFVTEFDGQYVLVVLKGEEIYAARDPVGLKPLYYSSNSEFAAISTERKALWKLGAKSVKIFPPGHLWRLQQGETPRPVRLISRVSISDEREAEISERLRGLLSKAVSERISGSKRVGVSFSGGLDSSITAHLLSRLDINPLALIVGVRGSPATEWAKEAADLLGIEAKGQEYEKEDVQETLRTCIWRTEEANPVKLGVAIPLRWCADLAQSIAVSTVFTGQGADELFGGYHRFLQVLHKGGQGALEEAIFESVRDAHATSYNVGEQATAPEGVRMIHPFTDWELIRLGLSIPAGMKIRDPWDGLRKRILRKTAMEMGLPRRLADVPKKAMQYSTGVDRCLKTLAMSTGLQTAAYLNTVFADTFKTF